MNEYYTWFPQIFNMSVTAGIVILCVLIARVFLKRMPKIFSYVLWSVVLLRLLCPVSFDSAVSLFAILDVPTNEGVITYVPENIVHTEFPAVNFPINAINTVINERLPQGEEQLVADPLEFPIAACTNLWIVGMAGMWLYAIWQFGKLAWKLLGAVHKDRNIYETDYIATPFVIGILRPRIYLPSGLEEKEQQYIIRHEQIHIRRFDPVFRLLAFLALSIHWFNPLVWLAFYLSGKDMEMSCDEAVMRQMGTDLCADYSTSLLKLATGKRLLQGMPLAFGEGNVKERIINIVRYKKPATIALVCVGIVVTGFAFVLAGNPTEDAMQENAGAQENVQVENTEDGKNTTGVYGTVSTFDGTDTSEGMHYIELGDVSNVAQNTMSGAIAHEYEEIEITPPSLHADMPLGADGPFLDYADEEKIIFHDYYGLFVFDLQSQDLVGAVDLEAIGCQSTQGDNYCEVSVNEYGTKVYLHPISEQHMYVYDVKEHQLIKQMYDMDGIETFSRLIKSPDFSFRDPGSDYLTVAGTSIEDYWYLESESGTIADICFVQVPFNEAEQEKETEKIRLFKAFSAE